MPISAILMLDSSTSPIQPEQQRWRPHEPLKWHAGKHLKAAHVQSGSETFFSYLNATAIRSFLLKISLLVCLAATANPPELTDGAAAPAVSQHSDHSNRLDQQQTKTVAEHSPATSCSCSAAHWPHFVGAGCPLPQNCCSWVFFKTIFAEWI